MENASKALIIAGAILLSILLISLGIMVFQQAKNTVGSANLDSTEIEAFNSQWDSYTGKNKNVNDVKSMISKVVAHNASEKKSGNERYITVTDSTVATPTDYNETALPGQASTLGLALSSGKRYQITASYADSGLINKITYSVQS